MLKDIREGVHLREEKSQLIPSLKSVVNNFDQACLSGSKSNRAHLTNTLVHSTYNNRCTYKQSSYHHFHAILLNLNMLFKRPSVHTFSFNRTSTLSSLQVILNTNIFLLYILFLFFIMSCS